MPSCITRDFQSPAIAHIRVSRPKMPPKSIARVKRTQRETWRESAPKNPIPPSTTQPVACNSSRKNTLQLAKSARAGEQLMAPRCLASFPRRVAGAPSAASPQPSCASLAGRKHARQRGSRSNRVPPRRPVAPSPSCDGTTPLAESGTKRGRAVGTTSRFAPITSRRDAEGCDGLRRGA
jgi:hypothetical protein